jgi:hypothetical protein
MSSIERTISVRLTDSQAREALRLSSEFAEYGLADTLDNRESNYLSLLGEFALSRWLYGSVAPVLEHRERSLAHARATGYVRDGHRDLPEARVDVKTTRDRHGKGWKNLNLLVSPRQVHRDTAYVLAVLQEAPTARLRDCREVLLAGWTDWLGLAEGDARFLGWSRCAASMLWPMATLDPLEWPVGSEALA